MIGLLVRLVVVVAVLAAGWIAGSLYPAPAFITNMIAQRAGSIAERLDNIDLGKLKERLSPEQFIALRHQAASAAADAGEAIIVERSEGPVEHMEGSDMTPAPQAGAGGFEHGLKICGGMDVSNAPPTDASGAVLHYAPVVNVNGVELAVEPTHDACLSSGFGSRNGRVHKGLDFHNPAGGPILAAADGVVIEKKYRDDYGNMLLIDHGHGVYTRYAHLSSFADGLAVGAHVTAGQEVGLMGNTASYAIPVHLHFELLLGDYSNPKGSFGLTPHSPFDYPAAA
jgi:murein DD-endopeptidase MepM/ murein hydrolase activator NlpD